MKPVLLPLASPELQHVTLLELMARSRVSRTSPVAHDMESKVSCETNSRQKGEVSPGIPEGIQRVLSDERASGLIHDLAVSGALRLFVDADALLRRCELIERQWRDEHLLRRFVQARASVPMIRRFFRSETRASIARLRHQLGVPPPTKPRAPRQQQLDTLLDAWRDLSAIEDLRERYLLVHRRCEGVWSLATLFATLNPDPGEMPSPPSSFSTQESHHV